MYTLAETNLERQHLLARFLDPMTLNSLNNIALPENAMILDVGCGLGDTSLLLSQRFPASYTIGLDADVALIEAAAAEKEWKRANLHFIQGNALHLPFDDNSFDFVFCRFVLHHIPQAFAVMHEMKRVCKQGGLLFAQEPDINSIYPYPENEAYNRCVKYVNKLFADALFGRKLLHHFRRLGITNIEHNAEIKLVDHHSGHKELFTLTAIALCPALISNKLLHEKEANEWIKAFRKTENDAEAAILSFPAVSVWGTKDK